jgi:hypothetical protein
MWGCPAEAKVFNPNIEKLDSKTVSCHFISYPERSKGYRFYCPDRYTKIVETRHIVFLEDNMIRGIMIAREISLQEKRIHVPTPMVEEPFFMPPTAVAPTVQDTIVLTPVVSSSVATMNEHEEPILEEPVLEEPIEPNITHEEEHQQSNVKQVPEAPRRSQRTRRSAISDDYEVYETEEFQMGDDPTSFEETMRSDHSSKWLKAMEDEMKSMSTNKV